MNKDNIIIKNASSDILSELESIKFDNSYISDAALKYKGSTFKLFNLKPYEANILKQMCLSLGFDCAVSRNTVTCKCDFTDVIIFASFSQLKKLVNKLKEQPFRLKQISELIDNQINSCLLPLKINNHLFDWKKQYIMGILNVTPDSFSDGGKYNNIECALKRVEELIQDGADIIDIGGESTKPNAISVSPDEEIKRVVPVIHEIRKHNIDIPISIDTRNYITAKASIEAGADIINDVSGLDCDNNLFNYVVTNNIPVVIMHSSTVPAVSNDYKTDDIIQDIYLSLYNKIDLLIKSGMEQNKIIADVGIGFGKSAQTNFEILKRMKEFTSLNVPLLLGISRKSFIRNTFNIDFDESDAVSALYSTLVEGINIHRVHNVKMLKRYLNYSSKIL